VKCREKDRGWGLVISLLGIAKNGGKTNQTAKWPFPGPVNRILPDKRSLERGRALGTTICETCMRGGDKKKKKSTVRERNGRRNGKKKKMFVGESHTGKKYGKDKERPTERFSGPNTKETPRNHLVIKIDRNLGGIKKWGGKKKNISHQSKSKLSKDGETWLGGEVESRPQKC